MLLTKIIVTVEPKPFEILFSILFLLVLFEVVTSKESRALISRLKPVWVRYSALLGALYTFIFVGSVSAFPGWVSRAPEVYTAYASTAFSFLIFFVSIYVVVRYKKSLRWELLAMTVSPLVFFTALVPGWSDFFVKDARLIGAGNDPNITANFIAVGLMISVVLYLYEKSRLRWLGGLFILLLMPVFLWANSRGAAISIAAVLVLVSLLYVSHKPSMAKARKVAALLGILVISVPVAFAVLPPDSQAYLYERFAVPMLSNEGVCAFAGDWALGGNNGHCVTFYESISTDSFTRSRGSLWSLAFEKSLNSPLGLGPAYHKWNPVERGTGAHNLWLEVPLTAGWGGLFIWLVFLGAIFRGAFSAFNARDFVGPALSATFMFLLINGIFIDIFTLRWLWLIMGMMVGYSIIDKDEKTKSISSPTDA